MIFCEVSRGLPMPRRWCSRTTRQRRHRLPRRLAATRIPKAARARGGERLRFDDPSAYAASGDAAAARRRGNRTLQRNAVRPVHLGAGLRAHARAGEQAHARYLMPARPAITASVADPRRRDAGMPVLPRNGLEKRQSVFAARTSAPASGATQVPLGACRIVRRSARPGILLDELGSLSCLGCLSCLRHSANSPRQPSQPSQPRPPRPPILPIQGFSAVLSVPPL